LRDRIAFSSEVGTGSREENASEQGAFSSEVGTGSREENASEQGAGAAGPSIVKVSGHDTATLKAFSGQAGEIRGRQTFPANRFVTPYPCG
jgi:hypothetical protein